jgi:methionine-rich copper-binding protein CopC
MLRNPGLKAAAIGAASLLGSFALAPAASAGPALSRPESGSEPPTRPHTELISSEPADGDTLTSELELIRLVFSGPIEEALSEIRLAGPLGLDLSLEARADPTMDRALLAAVPSLTPGAYRVAWRTVSVDGHAVSGSFVFFVPVQASSPESETRTSDEDGAAADRAEGAETDPDAASRFEPPPEETDVLGIGVPPSLALSRGAAVATLLALGGLLAIIVWVAPGESRRASKLAYLLALLLPILLIGHLFFWLRSVSPGDALDLETIPALLGTRAGGLELLRLGLAVAALATLAFGRHLGAAAFLTLLATLVSGATGHALSTDPAISVPAKAAHLAATQYWLGGLVYLIVEAKNSPEYRTTAQRIYDGSEDLPHRGLRGHHDHRHRHHTNTRGSPSRHIGVHDHVRPSGPGEDGGPGRARSVRVSKSVQPAAGSRGRDGSRAASPIRHVGDARDDRDLRAGGVARLCPTDRLTLPGKR